MSEGANFPQFNFLISIPHGHPAPRPMFGWLVGMLTEYATGVSFVEQIKLTLGHPAAVPVGTRVSVRVECVGVRLPLR